MNQILKYAAIIALAVIALVVIRNCTTDPNERFCEKAGPSATYYISDENDNLVPMSCEDLLYKDGDLSEPDSN